MREINVAESYKELLNSEITDEVKFADEVNAVYQFSEHRQSFVPMTQKRKEYDALMQLLDKFPFLKMEFSDDVLKVVYKERVNVDA